MLRASNPRERRNLVIPPFRLSLRQTTTTLLPP
jgi:hypothetical protein